MKITDEMVQRFLNWRLPEDFAPDGGVAFTPPSNPNHAWPVGTNVFTAIQARAMLEYAVGAAPETRAADKDRFARPGQGINCERGELRCVFPECSCPPSRSPLPETGTLPDDLTKALMIVRECRVLVSETDPLKVAAEVSEQLAEQIIKLRRGPVSATRTSGRTVRDAAETAEDFSGPPAIVSTTQERK